ncbi:hypothetical protein Dimus_004302, partial [Dionaea muscipula]
MENVTPEMKKMLGSAKEEDDDDARLEKRADGSAGEGDRRWRFMVITPDIDLAASALDVHGVEVIRRLMKLPGE